jgi:tripartite-type tricarboxylate transporter receptor subunit TctC
LLAERLSATLATQVFVENHPGAGGVVGSDIVAKAQADGYTLIIGNAGSHGINAAVYAKLPYDIQRDFVPVSQVAVSPNILVVNPEVPATNAQHSSPTPRRGRGNSATRRAATAAARICRWNCSSRWRASTSCTFRTRDHRRR